MVRTLVLISLVGFAYSWFPTDYPPYCHKDVSTNEIPPLTTAQLAQVSRLKQLQVLIRHGARTIQAEYTCWTDYDVQWNNCNVTELMIPSNSYSTQSRAAPWLFRKLYDGSPNELGGDCLTGQLLGEGYVQHIANGNYLFQQYLNQSNPAFNLFPTNQWEMLNSSTQIYLRSDDIQRTLMSGQTLMSAFFNVSGEVEVPWHTGDYNLDQIYPNTGVCPGLNTLGAALYASEEFVAENTSARVVNLNNQLDTIFGAGLWSWPQSLDCVMSTVCTGRELPEGMTQEIFNNTIEQATYIQSFEYKYNNSQWSKMAMGNLAWQVRNNIETMLNGEGLTSAGNVTTPLKLVLFSAHDSTLMPFLAAILLSNYDGQWSHYASLLTIELYESAADPDSQDPSDDLFRIVYNGVPQTVPGCDDTLCSVGVLLDALSFGQEFMPGCEVSAAESTDDDADCSSSSSDDDGLETEYWILIVFLSLLVGFGGGAGAVYVLDTKNKTYGGQEESNRDSSVQMHAKSPLQIQ